MSFTRSVHLAVLPLAVSAPLLAQPSPEKPEDLARASDSILAVNASQFGVSYPETFVLMQNRRGLRIEYCVDRSRLQLWTSPLAGRSLDYRDRNWSNRGGVETVLLNGRPLGGTLQLPDRTLKAGGNTVLVRMSARAGPREELVSSTVRLLSAAGRQYQVIAYGQNRMTFRNLRHRASVVDASGPSGPRAGGDRRRLHARELRGPRRAHAHPALSGQTGGRGSGGQAE